MAELPPDDEGRILSLLPLAKWIAADVYKHFGGSVEFEDLYQDGLIGAMDAVSRYDESLGFTLGTFAGRRIRGSIIDGIRDRDVLSRGHRLELIREGRSLATASLDEEVRHARSDHAPITLGDLIPDVRAECDFDQVELADAVRRAVEALPERMRYVVIEYFWKDQTLAQIGRSLGLTESRASQILSKAKAWMRMSLYDTIVDFGESDTPELVIALG